MCCHCHNYVANVIIILRNQNTIKPFFNFSDDKPVSIAIKRFVSCTLDISSEKTATP